MPIGDDGKTQQCGAHSRRTGNPCKGPAVRGGTRCRMHGGTQQAMPRGDPRRGGAPVTTGLYASILKPDMLADYDAAEIGTLDHDIKLRRAFIAHFLKLYGEKPTGGILVSGTTKEGVKTVRFKPYVDILRDLQDSVRKDELARRAIMTGPPPEDDSALHDAWAQAVADQKREDEER